MTVRTTWLLNPGQTRADTRLGAAGTWTPTDATQTRSGVVPGGTALNLTGSTMTGTVALGRAVVQGTSTQGAYGFVVTAAETFTVANGHASLNRIDSVFATIYDSAYDTSGLQQGAIVYVQGTAAASPTAPTSVPNSTAYVKLWDIAVAAGSSAGSPINWATALTDQRVYTTALGGITPGSSVAGAYAGQWRDNGGILERYTGSAWESALRTQNSGQVLIGDVPLTRSATTTLQVGGNEVVTGNLTVNGIGQSVFAIKSSSTSRASNTTAANDPHLTAAVSAAGTYRFDCGLFIDIGDINADILVQWAFPAGTLHYTGDGPASSLGTSSTTSSGEWWCRQGQATSPSGPIAYGVSNSASTAVRLWGSLVATGTGSLTLQWAQFTSSGTATTVLAGSWLELRRVA